ncbi:MAG: hypothetical protein IPM29_17975 [Planctomycetes bacterium]|nr:hypothetical protein [Planctomycetota bacterium]
MKSWLPITAAGLLLFVATILVLLAAQGRLDYEGTRGIPVLSWFYSDPYATSVGTEPDRPLPADAGPQLPRAPSAVTAAMPPAAPLAEPAAAGPGTEPGAGAADLFRYPPLDSGVTPQEIDELLRSARRLDNEVHQRLAQVEAREQDLAAREQDLADRENAIAVQMTRVDAAREALDERIRLFESKVKLVERDQIAGLVAYGSTLASFDPQRAAALVVQEWGDDVGRDRITKVLTLMDPVDADAILQRIPDESIRAVLVARLDVVVQDRDR